MTNSIRFHSLYMSLMAIAVFSGCRKFVQIDPPSTVLVSASTYSNATSATSALTNIYTQMLGESYKRSFSCGLQADELGPAAGSLQLVYQNALTALNDGSFGVWTGAYSYIYQANAVIEGLQTYKGVIPAIANQLTGEARFIRAFWYFYLVNSYGDVPLALTTDYNANGLLGRSLKADCYQQMVTDLKAAQGLLNGDYVDASDTLSTNDRIRPNKAAAAALLARVYLYMGNKYDSAEAQATSVINDGRYSLEPDLNNVFLANSSEAIWQIGISQPDNGGQTRDGNSFVFVAAPDGRSNAPITSWLLNSFEPGDQRRAQWIKSLTSGSNTWYYPFKYQVKDNAHNPNGRTEFTMVLRLGEQYLIRAEARIMQNKFSDAVSDLNVIRQRAGLPGYAGPMTQSAIMDAIVHERQVELFCEWGHRWFDLIRLGRIGSVMGAPGSNITQQKGGTWDLDNHQTLYPIKLEQLAKDPNLTQNPGY